MVPWGSERMPQRNQRFSGVNLHRSTNPKWEQDQTEKSNYGMDRKQKAIWYDSSKLENNKLPQNVQNITRTHKPHRENYGNLVGRNDCRRKKLGWNKDAKMYFSAITLIIHNTMMSLNHILGKCTPRYKLSRSQDKINHLMYMDDIKLFEKNEKELETQIHVVSLFSKDIRMEFGIEKCAVVVMKSGKRHITDGIELPN